MCDNAVGFNCTNYVSYRLSMNGVPSFMGACGHSVGANAASWDERARGCGIVVDSRPARGAVIQWDGYAPMPSGSGNYTAAGHVAYVDAVEGDSVYISEASCGMKKAHRAVLTWPFTGASSGAVEILHPMDLGPASDPAVPAKPVFTGAFYFSSSRTSVTGGSVTGFGQAGDVPLIGDWNGDGLESVGVYRGGNWHLNNQNDASGVDYTPFLFGGYPGDIPVVGDWDGDGRATPGIFRPSVGTWYLNNGLDGSAEVTEVFGDPSDTPVVGDWDGDGVDSPGVFRSDTATWYLDNNFDRVPDVVFQYGMQGDKPVTGDWDGDGPDTIGVVRDGVWHLTNNVTTPGAGLMNTFGFGVASDIALAADWNGSGTASPVVAR